MSPAESIAQVAFVQDHLVQRGGAERALLSMVKAAPNAPVYTTFYRPDACYPELGELDLHTHVLDRIGFVRRHHRAALPVLPAAISHWRVDADVLVCGTSGWAQGVRSDGRKIVYFHAIARWVHEAEAYLKYQGAPTRGALKLLRPYLEGFDRRSVATGHRFLTTGTIMRDRLREIYGIEAEILPVPNAIDVAGPQRPIAGIEPGFILCPSRLMPYKNIDAVVAGFAHAQHERLVVAGEGPLLDVIRAAAPPNVTMLGTASDDQLRWLYQNCSAIVSAAYEPFGLVPIEAASFGRPSIVLRGGGFVDTVIEDETGVFFDRPDPDDIAAAVRRFRTVRLSPERIATKAAEYGEPRFVDRLREIIEEEAPHPRAT